METIKMYLDNMFSGINMTEELYRIKNDLLISMEDKYNELKQKGKSENEAIGVVISEFGNIEEIKNEFAVKNAGITTEGARPVELAELQGFLAEKRKNALTTAAAVALIITGAAIFVFTSMLTDVINFPGADSWLVLAGLTALIIFVAISVGMILMSSAKLRKYEYFAHEFTLPDYVRQYAESKRIEFLQRYGFYIASGVTLCILSVLFVIIPALLQNDILMHIGVPLLLITVAAAVIPLIYGGMNNQAYNMVLELEEYDAKNKKADKLIGAVASVFWTVIVAVYLLISFTMNNWAVSWIIWPVAGILFGGFSALASQIINKE